MTRDWHGRRGGHRHGPGRGRPPWWPENEPFPPTGAWRGKRRRFARRVLLFLVMLFGLVFAASALAVALLSGAFGPGEDRGLVLPGALLGLVLLVVGVTAVGRAARRMLGPVGEVMEAADRVAGGDYTTRLEERGPREIRRLVRSFNAMTGRLASGERQRRDLLADLAHELRTPLSVIQGNVEGVLDGVYEPDRAHLEPVLEETRVMARLLDDLQVLSTAEAGALPLHREAVAPARLLDDAAAAFRSRAETAGVTLSLQAGPGLPALDVDAVRIGQVLANLLHNAVDHTPSGGRVVVSARRAEDGRWVAFAVQDTGPGIPAEVLPHAFGRFVKSADSRGAGLGLAIARSLVEAHGGEIAAESPPGEGTTIRFVLPAAGSA
jgi:signal transduction histidine kinase